MPVFMTCTVEGDSPMANVQGEARVYYICHKTFTKSCIFHVNKASL